MKKIIPIFYTMDENYAKYACVSISSLIKNASKDYDYKIYILQDGLKEETKQTFKELENSNTEIIFKELTRSLDMIPTKDVLAGGDFTLTIYFRIFIPTMFPEYDKGIYLDSDTVVNGDISKLFEIDLEGNLIGAIQDKSISHNELLVSYIENVVVPDHKGYINSGILLMNLKEFRKVKFDEHFMYLLNKYKFNTIAPDQDYINSMCHGKIMYLEYGWNAMPGEKLVDLEEPMIIHYNLLSKPWHYDNIAYNDYFWKYAKMTKYYDDIKLEKENYNEKLKKRDTSNIESMVKRSQEIIQDELTFKSVFEKNMESRL